MPAGPGTPYEPPEADALEQRIPVDRDADPLDDGPGLPVSIEQAPEADVLEQSQDVQILDEDYPRDPDDG